MVRREAAYAARPRELCSVCGWPKAEHKHMRFCKKLQLVPLAPQHSSTGSSSTDPTSSSASTNAPLDVLLALEYQFSLIYDAEADQRALMIRQLYRQYHPDKNDAPYAHDLFIHIRSFCESNDVSN